MVNEFIRVGDRYRGTYIEVLEKDGYTVIIYCDVKPNEGVRLSKDYGRLIAYIGMEKVEYEDTMDNGRITGRIDQPQYKYISRIPIEKKNMIKI